MRQRTPSRSNGHAPSQRERSASPWLDAGPNGEGMQVFEFPTYMLGRISGIVRRSLIPKYVEPHGLSIPEWRLLAFLVVSEPSSFNEICGALVMDRGQVSRTLPVLLKKGAIKRTVTLRKGPLRRGESGQQTKFAATTKGRNLYERALPLAQRHQMVLLGALNEQEKAALYSALRKITHAAEAFEQKQASEAKPKPAPRPARPRLKRPGRTGQQKNTPMIAGGLS